MVGCTSGPGARSLALIFVVLFSAAPSGADDTYVEKIGAYLDTHHEELIAVRRDLHRHPEISDQEARTAGVVAERLRAAGYEVRTGVGGHGVVATLKGGKLRGGKQGPVVGYRADMDAMPSQAPDPVDFRSLTPGVRHICGHDIHTAVGIGVGEALAAVRAELPGTVKLYFQGAEETGTGARAMLADGALDGEVPGAIFAVHNGPMPAGQIGAVEGPTLAGRDGVEIRLRGSGDLQKAAGLAADAIKRASSQEAPASPAALAALPLTDDLAVAGVFRSSRAGDENAWLVVGMISHATEEARQQAKRRLADALAALSIPDVTYELNYQDRRLSGVWSDPALVRSTHAPIRAALGDDGLVIAKGVGPAFSEDFGFFLDDIPGAMYWLGVGPAGMPHSPGYVADETAIVAGAKAMATVLFHYLATH